MPSARYRLVAWHSVENKQIEKTRTFSSQSIKVAKAKFRDIVTKDDSLHEAVLTRELDGKEITDYIGYI